MPLSTFFSQHQHFGHHSVSLMGTCCCQHAPCPARSASWVSAAAALWQPDRWVRGPQGAGEEAGKRAATSATQCTGMTAALKACCPLLQEKPNPKGQKAPPASLLPASHSPHVVSCSLARSAKTPGVSRDGHTPTPHEGMRTKDTPPMLHVLQEPGSAGRHMQVLPQHRSGCRSHTKKPERACGFVGGARRGAHSSMTLPSQNAPCRVNHAGKLMSLRRRAVRMHPW